MIVVGLGAVGAATVRALAKDGARVVGFDQFAPPHPQGSSHGDTRITRLGVGEGEIYGPLVARSHELWRELEAELDEQLLVQCGALILGVEGATGQHNVEAFVSSTVRAARAAGVAHELLDATEIRRRYPVMTVAEGTTGYFEPEGGYLRAEACVAAQLASARRWGADLRLGVRVREWAANDGAVVTTDEGTFRADTLVLAAGPWMAGLVPHFAPAFAVFRQVQFWFSVRERFAEFAALPVYIWLYGTVPGQFLYGFPAIDGPAGGVKLAAEDFSDAIDPDAVRRDVAPREVAAMFDEAVRHQFPDLGPDVVRTTTCLYTVTPDFHFLVDRHPGLERVLVVSPCSGHGFKHSAAVGEAVAQWARSGERPAALAPFGFARFAQ